VEDPSDVRPADGVSTLVDDVAAFGRRLRAEGLTVEPARLATFARAIALTSPETTYWAGRAVFISRPADTPAYDRAFFAHYGAGFPAERTPVPRMIARVPDVALETPDGSAEGTGTASVSPASRVEQLRHKRFEHCTEEELARLGELMRELTWSMPPRRTRRRRSSRRGELDMARTLRRSMRPDGEAAGIQWHQRRLTPRRLVLLLDISGSMSAYSRALLIFAHAALSSDGGWEAFCFGTRLTRLTPQLRTRTPDVALRAASDAVLDWDGGTRIGDAVKALVDGWGQTQVLRGAIVIVCSDGLDTGEPDVLAEQMSRLHRLSREVVWLNPLKGLVGYEPIARGMAAAMPYIDLFATGDDLASLEALSLRLSTMRGRARRPSS
jgi:uncharacterized protein with von Willebrand factor type A (vWA) domain